MAQWRKEYPGQLYNPENKMNHLFTYFQYPQAIRSSIQSRNIIERMTKEVRRHIKAMDFILKGKSALKIVYLRVAELEYRYSRGVLNGFFKCSDELSGMFFSTRYPGFTRIL